MAQDVVAFTKMPSQISFFSVDAGSSCIYSSSNKLIFLIRIAAVFYKNTIRMATFQSQAFISLQKKENNWHVQSIASSLDASKKNTEHDKNNTFKKIFCTSFDVDKNNSVEHIESSLRVDAEQKCITLLMHDPNVLFENKNINALEPYIVVYDGSILRLPDKNNSKNSQALLLSVVKQSSQQEKQHAYEKIKENIVQLEKTSKTETLWCFSSKKTDTTKTFWVQMHPKAYPFEVLVENTDQTIEYTKIFGVLSWYATDPLFFGYPYPLILVDQCARISEQETNAYVALALTKESDAKIVYDTKKYFLVHDHLDKLNF